MYSYGGYQGIFNVSWKVAYGPNMKESEKTMGGTKLNGILKGGLRLWMLYITDVSGQV